MLFSSLPMTFRGKILPTLQNLNILAYLSVTHTDFFPCDLLQSSHLNTWKIHNKGQEELASVAVLARTQPRNWYGMPGASTIPRCMPRDYPTVHWDQRLCLGQPPDTPASARAGAQKSARHCLLPLPVTCIPITWPTLALWYRCSALPTVVPRLSGKLQKSHCSSSHTTLCSPTWPTGSSDDKLTCLLMWKQKNPLIHLLSGLKEKSGLFEIM